MRVYHSDPAGRAVDEHKNKLTKHCIDLTGKVFGRLTALRKVGVRKSDGVAMWLCRCECGTETMIRSDLLRQGRTKSCGCLSRELTSKRLKKYYDPIIRHLICGVLAGIKTRCYNKTDSSYPNWGGRGVYVCDEWLNNPESFAKWAIDNGWVPGKHLSVDRYPDKDGPYAPWNCRIATPIQQNNNMRSNRVFELMNKKMSIADWARYLGIDPRLLWYQPDHVVLSRLKQFVEMRIKEGKISLKEATNGRV